MHKFISLIFLLCLFQINNLKAEIIEQNVEANACEDVTNIENKTSFEYKAVDKASLAAVKTSGFIQKHTENMNIASLDVISYQIIDEYLKDIKHEITHDEKNRICIKLTGKISMEKEKLSEIANRYKIPETPANIVEIAEEVNSEIALKPQTLDEKKLVFIENMHFWDGSDANYYTEFIKELMSSSEYFYITDNSEIADYRLIPSLKKAVVDKIDNKNYKMQMNIEVSTIATNLSDFAPITETQNHFILFSSDKDEQETADTLIRKLLKRAIANTSKKINTFEQNNLEKNKVRK